MTVAPTTRTFQILFVLIAINAAAGLFQASGLAGAMGVEPVTGADDTLEDARDLSEQISSIGGLTDLGGAIFQLVDILADVFQVLYTGPLMLVNIGVPTWLVTAVFAPLWAIIFRDMAYFLTSR